MASKKDTTERVSHDALTMWAAACEQLEAAQATHRFAVMVLRSQYGLDEQDAVDRRTGVIFRQPQGVPQDQQGPVTGEVATVNEPKPKRQRRLRVVPDAPAGPPEDQGAAGV